VHVFAAWCTAVASSINNGPSLSTVRAKRPCGRAPNRAEHKGAVFRQFDVFIAGVLTRSFAEFRRTVARCAPEAAMLDRLATTYLQGR
jgi:hypothetical protein